jgi:hypothetical protein
MFLILSVDSGDFYSTSCQQETNKKIVEFNPFLVNRGVIA